jgi:hypothetical protein
METVIGWRNAVYFNIRDKSRGIVVINGIQPDKLSCLGGLYEVIENCAEIKLSAKTKFPYVCWKIFSSTRAVLFKSGEISFAKVSSASKRLFQSKCNNHKYPYRSYA